MPVVFGAGNETRTRDPNLGKVVLYVAALLTLWSMWRYLYAVWRVPQ